jgi:hypothetical protein
VAFVKRKLSKGTHREQVLIQREMDLIDVETGVETAPRLILLAEANHDLTRAHRSMKSHYFESLSLRVLYHASSLELKVMTL